MKKIILICLLSIMLSNSNTQEVPKKDDSIYNQLGNFFELYESRFEYYDSINWHNVSDLEKDRVINENYPLGAIVLDSYSVEEGLQILFVEASYLSSSAQIFLDVIYKSGIEGKLDPFNRDIFDFWKNEAQKKMGRPNLNLGIYYMNGLGVEKNWDTAQKYLELSQEYSSLAESYYYLGYCYESKGLIDEAINQWETGLSLDYSDCAYALAITYRDKQEYKKAIDYFNQVLGFDSDDISANLNLAQMHIEGWGTNIDLDLAIDYLNKVLEVSPNIVEAYINLAAAFIGKGNNANELGEDGDEYYNMSLLSYIKAAQLGHTGIQEWLNNQDIDWEGHIFSK